MEIESKDDMNVKGKKVIAVNDKEMPSAQNEISNEVWNANINCDECEDEEAKNDCEQCGIFICSQCKIKVLGESVLDFFKKHNFQNYTCNTVHY